MRSFDDLCSLYANSGFSHIWRLVEIRSCFAASMASQADFFSDSVDVMLSDVLLVPTTARFVNNNPGDLVLRANNEMSTG